VSKTQQVVVKNQFQTQHTGFFMPNAESPAQMVLVPCTVTKGMFSNESAVQISVEGISVSLFVDKALIEWRDGAAYLRVTFAGENGKPENRTVLLPSESFETGSRWLSVPKDMLLEAA
jgi:hypothetical protein